eukprot:CAMPEP_0202920012 /NCGR_PEP_ID=MMETSP1392-20130828/76632_1 /ASSEMBLY_ACC=CAM_ASM_000868 /TAXON_ID=225041 /ORGANISM="Chlamydomonas chlamydogama, Strain SAG 11-48b" /LENGTH=71 /DNA_ID=CAMNT_0049613489 /DNA_START=2304 /DNA_END=2520 /DNA_ORIENTATION=+
MQGGRPSLQLSALHAAAAALAAAVASATASAAGAAAAHHSGVQAVQPPSMLESSQSTSTFQTDSLEQQVAA